MVKQPSHSSELASKTILSVKPQPPLIQAKHWGIFLAIFGKCVCYCHDKLAKLPYRLSPAILIAGLLDCRYAPLRCCMGWHY